VAAVTPRKLTALTISIMELRIAVASIIAGTWIGTLLLARVDAELAEHTRIWRWHASRRSCNLSSRSVGMISLGGGESSLKRLKPWASMTAVAGRKLTALTVAVMELGVAVACIIAGAWIKTALLAFLDTVQAKATRRVHWGWEHCARNFSSPSVLMRGGLISLEASLVSCVVGVDATID
jgi:hypothetical protein